MALDRSSEFIALEALLLSRQTTDMTDHKSSNLGTLCQGELKSVLNYFWFGVLLYVPGNSYGHVGTVSSPNHTFFLGKLEQAVNQYFVHILSLVTDNNPS